MALNVLGVFNRLLPFATPGTPLIQDLLHLAAICILLYFAPQIQEGLRRRKHEPDGPLRRLDDVDPITLDSDREATQIEHLDPEQDVPLNGQPADADDAANDGEVQPAPIIEEGQPGPANRVDIRTERNVGAKKAKSLARKDQRRAYHEFMRSQGDAQRAKDAEGATEREVALVAEKERRRAAEAALEAKKTKERERRREREEQERKVELRRRELVISLVRDELEARNMCDLFKVARQVGDDVDEEWIEQILKASVLIGRKGDVMTMITGMGWVVRVTSEDMAKLYWVAVQNGMGGEDGKIEYEELGAVLETMLRT